MFRMCSRQMELMKKGDIMKRYLKPEFEEIRYKAEDVLTTTGESTPTVPHVQIIDGEDD